MAISDVGTKLYAEGTTAGKYSVLVSIKSAPATGSAPKSLDTTTLDSLYTTGIPDRPETPEYKFIYNYTETDYEKVLAAVSLTDDKNFLIVYGDGSGEKFTGRGSTWKEEVSVGKIVEAGLSFAVSSHDHVKKADVTTMIATA